jgi:hypothetical protein
MRALFGVGVLFLCSLSAVYPAQVSPPSKQTAVAGNAQATIGSPVELSDATYTMLRFESEASKLQLIGEAVKIRNVSGRAIRRLSLRFVHNHLGYSGDVCRGPATNRITVVDELASGETRDYTTDRLRMTWSAQENDLALTVIATGAEFADGSHWAALRSQLCPRSAESLSQPGCYLMSRQCTLTDDAYSVLLEVADPKIVAYRLGVVNDTADSFEVRTGEWIDLTDDQRVRGARLVDAGKSLNSKLMFPRQAAVSTIGGKQITTLFGVSIFVAELRFADGGIWRQDPSREALFWNN